MLMKKLFVVCCVVLSGMGWGATVQASTINVPGDYSSIQTALDNASSGDIVLVADGAYTENITWPNVDGIKLRSVNGASSTTIDGNSSGSVITLSYSGITLATEIDGFTITNGSATNTTTNGGAGAGIFCNEASPTIKSNIITGNTAVNAATTGEGGSAGGGISCNNYSSPTIRNNTITNNSATNNYEGNNWNPGAIAGGGIACNWYSSPTIENNTITSNTGTNGVGWGASGGGIACSHYSDANITNNTIQSNTATYDTSGGGILCIYASDATIDKNTISDNIATSTRTKWSGAGGGITCYKNSHPIITNNVIDSNSATETAGGQDAGGIFNRWDSYPSIINNTIVYNTGNDAGGIYDYWWLLMIKNCIVYFNTGVDISVGTHTNYYSGLPPPGGYTGGVTYCDIEDGYSGTGNITSDPLFGNPTSGLTYDLKLGSPCLNAGTSSGAPSTDIVGRSRPNPVGSNPDMGAYEQNADASLAVELSLFTASIVTDGVALHWRTESEGDNLGFNVYRSLTKDGDYQKLNADLIEGAGSSSTRHDYSFTDRNVVHGITYWYKLEDVAFDGTRTMHGPIAVTPQAEEAVEAKALPKEFGLSQNFPNPFNPITTIGYDLPEPSNVTLTIYTITGQQVATVVSSHQEPGHYEVPWDGSAFGDGGYLYRLEAGDFVETRRMLLLK